MVEVAELPPLSRGDDKGLRPLRVARWCGSPGPKIAELTRRHVADLSLTKMPRNDKLLASVK